eukprot:1316947-Rhodomonas_salina.1
MVTRSGASIVYHTHRAFPHASLLPEHPRHNTTLARAPTNTPQLSAQTDPVLRDDDVRVGDPLHVARVVEQGRARLRRDVEQVQVAPLVAEQQLRGRRIELEPVNLGVVGDCCHVPRRDQV